MKNFKKGPARNAFSIPASNALHSNTGWADAGGFALLELLIIIAIVAVLVSIIFMASISAKANKENSKPTISALIK